MDRPYLLVPIREIGRYEARAYAPGNWWGDCYLGARVLVSGTEEERLWRVKYERVHTIPIADGVKVWRMTSKEPRYRCYFIDRPLRGLECTMALGRCFKDKETWPLETGDKVARELGYDSWWWSEVSVRKV